MACGIYKLTNKLNGKSYIGQAIDIRKRWREHKCASLNPNNKDFNMVIHKAIRKYGIENFNLEIIEECEQSELNDKEIYWIDKYNTYHQGYNASIGGNNYDHLGTPIEAYDMQGNFVKEYPSIKSAANDIGASYAALVQVLYGRRKSCKNLQWKHKNSDIQIKEYKSRQGGSIPIVQMNDENNILQEFESSYEAARILSLDASCITKCCKGKLKHHGGFVWKYKKEV